MPTYTLNFSRGGSTIIAQYYNFLRLGREGYTRIMENITKNAKYLASRMNATGYFENLNPDQLLPVVAVKLKKEENFTLYDLTAKLRERGWIIPAYTLPPDAEDVVILRVVVKENLSRDMIDILCKDIVDAFKFLRTEKCEEIKTIKGKRSHHIC